MHAIRQIARNSTSVSKASIGSNHLSDSFGRIHDYLRISLTERCNLRCSYCMPADGIKLTQSDQCLSLEELERLTTILVQSCGIRKIRLTGGEPTIDRKLLPLLSHLNGLRGLGLDTIALTTNGLGLRKKCLIYRDLGLDRVNISLDTLKESRFEQITRRKGLKHVLEGLDKAVEADFERIKLNCVVMRGINDDELADFVRLSGKYPIEVRFIEMMPFFGNNWSKSLLVPYKEMLDNISGQFRDIVRIDQSPHMTAKLFKLPEAPGTIGFITSMTENFCSGCNRLRVTSDGNLKVCLLGNSESSLRDLMRNGATDSEIVQAIQTALNRKKRQHAGTSVLKRDVFRPMIKIEANKTDNDSSKGLTHIDSSGTARMVNIGSKEVKNRTAIARGQIYVGNHVLGLIVANSMRKGDVITVSKIAGIMGAKMTANLIPMCHQIPLDHVDIDVHPRETDGALEVTAKVQTSHKTGVEMECLTAVSVTLLTIYDMCKSIGTNMRITNLELVSKRKSSI